MASDTIHVRYLGSPREAARLLALARDTLARATEEAARTMREARSCASAHLRSVRRRARANGVRNGERAAKIQLLQTLRAHDTRFREQLAAANLDCLNLVIHVSEEILASEIRGDKRSIVNRMQRALSTLIEQRALRLFVSREDYAEVRSLLTGEATMPLAMADDLAPGNARIETVSGMLELNWREHLAAVHSHLRAKLEKNLQNPGDPPCSPSDPSLMN